MNLLDRFVSMLARRVIAATVTDADVSDGGRRGRMDDADLITGFVKWVAVANSRNAAAVASTPIRVMRRATFASAFEGKPVGGLELRRMKSRAGPMARKALDMSEDVEEVTDPDHPLVSLLRNVNPHMNHFDLMELCESHQGLAGDAFWLPLMGPNGWPVEIWPLAPNYVEVVPDQQAFISGYRYGRDSREREKPEALYPSSQIIHFKRPNPTGDPYRGFSDLQKCIEDANLSVQFTQFASAMIENGMHPATLILAPKATKEQAREIERTLNAKHQGAQKAGKAAVLYGSLIEDIKPLNLSEGEVKFLQSDEKVREVIAAAHDMPVELLTLRPGGLGDGGEAMPQWMKFGVLPRLKRIEDKLNERLCPMFNGKGGMADLFLVFDSPVEEDEKGDEDRAVNLFKGGLITKNEARIRINMPAVEGGDEFGAQASDPFAAFTAGMGGGLSLGGGLSFDKPGLSFNEPGGGGGLSLGGAGLEGAPRLALPQPPQRMTLAYLEDPWQGKALGDPVWTKADDRGANRRISGVEASMAAALRGWFRENLPEIVRRVHADGVNLREPEFLGGFLRAVDEPLGATVRTAFGFGVAEVRSRKGGLLVTKDDDLVGGNVQSILRVLEQERLRLADSVMQSLEHVIRANLRTGVAAGEGIGELQQRVADALGRQADYASERIARTETRRAFMVGRQEGWADTGVVAGKRWRLSSNPCPICVEIAARYSKARLNEPFVPLGTVVAGRALDFRPVMGGDAHPNDRCSIEPILEGEE